MRSYGKTVFDYHVSAKLFAMLYTSRPACLQSTSSMGIIKLMTHG